MGSTALHITVEFTGGLELLFSNQRIHNLTLPSNSTPLNISHLIHHLCDNVMQDSRKDMFMLDDHVRPGILVLINDADWELEGEEDYILQEGDTILFVSTLHGG